MKRDARLHGLSSDHHQGLVLARRITQGRVGTAEVRQRFDAELEPHFRAEEELILPALASAGEAALVQRTLDDHVALKAHLEAAERGDRESLLAFGTLLDAHIRFEERELFPAAEARLADAELERLRQRRPKTT